MKKAESLTSQRTLMLLLLAQPRRWCSSLARC